MAIRKEVLDLAREVIRLNAAGWNDVAIAGELGIEYYTLREFRLWLRLPSQRSSVRTRMAIGAAKSRNWRRRMESTFAVIRARHSEGWSDAEIAAEVRIDRRLICEWRKDYLGLPANGNNERRRAKVREKTREQLAAAGLRTLADLRREAHRAKIRAAGWPDWMLIRHAQILNLIWMRGPMTRREVAAAMGIPWKAHAREMFHSNFKANGGSTYFGDLLKAGYLIKYVKKMRTGPTGYHLSDVYTLSGSIRRGKVYGQINADGTVTLPGRGMSAALDAGDADGRPGPGETRGHRRDRAEPGETGQGRRSEGNQVRLRAAPRRRRTPRRDVHPEQLSRRRIARSAHESQAGK